MADEVLSFKSVTIRREGFEILLLDPHGRLLLRLPWEAALRLGGAIMQQARRVEEIVKRDQVVFDQAILNRRGVPIGLINDPHLQQEAMKEAAWNSQLRRYLPGGVQSQEAVGTPSLIKHPPRRTVNGGSGR